MFLLCSVQIASHYFQQLELSTFVIEKTMISRTHTSLHNFFQNKTDATLVYSIENKNADADEESVISNLSEAKINIELVNDKVSELIGLQKDEKNGLTNIDSKIFTLKYN